jgi:predicted O-methyltransferase YrrM
MTCTTWHRQNTAVWQAILAPALPRTRPVNWLEAGSYAGGSASWVAEHLLGSDGTITCIDTWGDAEVEAAFDAWASTMEGRVVKRKGRTQDILPTLDRESYDGVYIDADHDASAVLRDAVLAWPLVRVGGFIVFDDYQWTHPNHKVGQLAPSIGIDAFLSAYRLQVVQLHCGTQAIARKRRSNNHAD